MLLAGEVTVFRAEIAWKEPHPPTCINIGLAVDDADAGDNKAEI